MPGVKKQHSVYGRGCLCKNGFERGWNVRVSNKYHSAKRLGGILRYLGMSCSCASHKGLWRPEPKDYP